MKNIGLTIYLVLTAISFIAVGKKHEISFKSGNVTLRGTLYLPKGDGPFPSVVFVHGSGPELAANSSYSAKWMAKNGFIALTFDKRGAGRSDGDVADWQRFNFDTLANDVASAIDFLMTRQDVDQERIGLFATSQGGWVASLVSNKRKLAYMVMRSVSATTVEEDRIFERSMRLKNEGISDVDIKKSIQIQKVEAKTVNEKEDEWSDLFKQFKNESWFKNVYRFEDPFSSSIVNYRIWYATIASFDPIPFLEETSVPVFWIFGDPMLDQLSPVQQSVSNVKSLETKGKEYTLVQIKGEGHNIKESAYREKLKIWLEEI